MPSFHGKAILGSIIVFILVAVLIPDLLVELVVEVSHGLFELAHILFEFIEESLDIVIEHLLGTGLHATQIIVFYILMSILAYVGYRFALKIPAKYRRLRDNIQMSYNNLQSESISYWQNLATINKVKWIAIGISSFLILIFFGF